MEKLKFILSMIINNADACLYLNKHKFVQKVVKVSQSFIPVIHLVVFSWLHSFGYIQLVKFSWVHFVSAFILEYSVVCIQFGVFSSFSGFIHLGEYNLVHSFCDIQLVTFIWLHSFGYIQFGAFRFGIQLGVFSWVHSVGCSQFIQRVYSVG